MKAITNLLTFLNENWTLILICAGAIVGIIAKTRRWLKLSREEKIQAAIEALRLSMLSFVTEAEREYGSGTGKVKRAQVLQKIFTQYPVLAQAVSIEKVTALLDKMIDESLDEMRKLLESNTAFYDLVNNVLTLTEEELKELDLTGILVPGQTETTEEEELQNG